jgi:hypothetical protein
MNRRSRSTQPLAHPLPPVWLVLGLAAILLTSTVISPWLGTDLPLIAYAGSFVLIAGCILILTLSCIAPEARAVRVATLPLLTLLGAALVATAALNVAGLVIDDAAAHAGPGTSEAPVVSELESTL